VPRLHDSVIYCDRCDHYVAAIEISRCEECGAPICPDCTKPTKDPALNACSYACAAKLNKRFKKEAAIQPPILPEAA